MKEQDFFKLVGPRTALNRKRIKLAWQLAHDVHAGQTRDSGEPYIEHPVRVAANLIRLGYTSTKTIAVGLGHDVFEDWANPTNVLQADLGPEIWQGMELMSKLVLTFDPQTGQLLTRTKKPLPVYFAAIAAADPEDRAVKLLDRDDNLVDCVKWWQPDRRRRYVIETRTHLLPMARMTDPRIAARLELATDAADPDLRP